MTDPDTLEGFLRWGKSNYPADRYLVVLWGHGDAWQDERVQVMAIFDDDNPVRDKLTPNYRVRQAMERAGMRADILAFDACDMGILEAAYEFRGRADFMVASQELVRTGRIPLRRLTRSIGDRSGEIARGTGEHDSSLVWQLLHLDVHGPPDLSSVFPRWTCPEAAAVANAQRMARGRSARAGIDEVDFHDTVQTVRGESEDFVTPRRVPVATSISSTWPWAWRQTTGDEYRWLGISHLVDGGGELPRSGFGGHPEASGLSIYFPASRIDDDLTRRPWEWNR